MAATATKQKRNEAKSKQEPAKNEEKTLRKRKRLLHMYEKTAGARENRLTQDGIALNAIEKERNLQRIDETHKYTMQSNEHSKSAAAAAANEEEEAEKMTSKRKQRKNAISMARDAIETGERVRITKPDKQTLNIGEDLDSFRCFFFFLFFF